MLFSQPEVIAEAGHGLNLALASTSMSMKEYHVAADTMERKKEKFTLFSDHNGSLLRQQPGAMTIGRQIPWCKTHDASRMRVRLGQSHICYIGKSCMS